MSPCSLCSPALRRNGLVHHYGQGERKGKRLSTTVVLIGLAVGKAFVPTPRSSVLCLCVFPANALWVLRGPKLDCLVGDFNKSRQLGMQNGAQGSARDLANKSPETDA